MTSFKSIITLVLVVFLNTTSLFSQSYSAVTLSGKYWGIVDQNGKTTLDHQYYLIEPKVQYAGNMLAKSKDKKLGFISSKGTFTPCNCDQISPFSDGFSPIRIGKIWGYMNTKGQVVVKPSFDDVKAFREDKAWVKKDSKWFQINTSGERVFNTSFDAFKYFKNGYARVKTGENWGFINPNGEILGGSLKFTKNEDFHNGFAFVEVGDKWGVINTNGEFVIDAKYSKVQGFLKKGLAAVYEDDRVGLVNDEGIQVLASEYERVKVIDKNYAGIMKNGVWGIANNNGKIIAEPQFNKWLPGDGKSIQVLKGEQWGYLILSTGEIKLLGKYLSIKEFYNGMALVKKGVKWGYIDENFNEVISPRFLKALPFYTDLAVAKETDLYGYINKTGKFVIQPKFINADPFTESKTRNQNFSCSAQYKQQKMYNKIGFGLSGSSIILSADESKETAVARVRLNDGWGFINTKGEVQSKGYQNAEKFVNGFCRVRKNGLWGYVDNSGKLAIEPAFKLSMEMMEVCD